MAESWTTADFDFDLPDAQIAQHPSAERGASRMLVVDRGAAAPEEFAVAHQSAVVRARPAAPAGTILNAERSARPAAPAGTILNAERSARPAAPAEATIRDQQFADILDLIPAGDLLVVNATKVRHARFHGVRPSGKGMAEVLLIHPAPDDSWIAMGKPGSAMRPGKRITLGDDAAIETIEETPDGFRRVRFVGLRAEDAIAKYGRLPLPPYITRDPTAEDEDRYQTVYAAREGSVAAPTAGLHFTPALLDALRTAGVEIVELDLEVGPGTFKPVEVAAIGDHRMHSEHFEIPAATAGAIASCRARDGKVWAVGTTVVRALESAAIGGGLVAPGAADTNIMITPGYTFRVVDRLITNFHLPRSTLLMLVSAFAGHDTTMAAYRHAVAAGYRFYSYGDAMCVVGEAS